LNLGVLSAGQPSKNAARRVGDQYGGTKFFVQSRDCIDRGVIWGRRGVWCLLGPPPHSSVGVLRGTDAGVVIGPDADAEANKDSLFASCSRTWYRTDCAVSSRPTRTAAVWLVDDISAPPLTKEDVLVAVPPIRRRLPGL